MDTLLEELLSQIECPVCFEYMIPPIKLCSNGHSICKICKYGFVECPTCRGSLLEESHNHMAEIMSRSITHPCKYIKSGCTGHFLVDFKEEHEKVCEFRPHKCPFYITNECNMEGPLIDISSHIRKAHSASGSLREISDLWFNVSIPFSKTSEGRLNRHQALFILNKFFFFQCKEINNLFYIILMLVGEEEDAKRYTYKVTLRESDDFDTMSAKFRCRSYLQFTKDGFKKDQCASFCGEVCECR